MKQILLTALFLGMPFANYMSQTKEMNMSEAVRLAEEFVVNNGYTNLPPSKDKNRIKLEAIEHSSDIGAVLAARRNSLESRAYGAKAQADGSGWIVVFRYKGKGINAKSGRAVTMGPKGENIKMEHQNFFLKYVEKLSRR